jgi:hypothetical protein
MFSTYVRRLAVIYLANAGLVAVNLLLWTYSPSDWPSPDHMTSSRDFADRGAVWRKRPLPAAVDPRWRLAKPPISDGLREATRTEALGVVLPQFVQNNYQVDSTGNLFMSFLLNFKLLRKSITAARFGNFSCSCLGYLQKHLICISVGCISSTRIVLY